MKKKYLITIIVLCLFKNMNAQIPASSDINYLINTSKSDEFDGGLSKWQTPLFYWGGGYAHITNSNNLIRDGVVDIMISEDAGDETSTPPPHCYPNTPLEADENDPNCPILHRGGLQSQNHDFSYGYFEIYAKWPGYSKPGSPPIPSNIGFAPTFWLYFTDDYSSCIHDEIDIMEGHADTTMLGCDIEIFPDGSTYPCGIWDRPNEGSAPPCAANVGIKYDEQVVVSANPLFEDYHKYAAEWLPNKVTFFFDNQPIADPYTGDGIPNHEQYVVIDCGLNSNQYIDVQNTPLPLYYTIEYFRYYQLDMTQCNTSATMINQTQFDNFVFRVRNTITFGNNLNSIITNGGEIFRASEFTIYGNFTVPLGNEFTLIPTECF